MLWAKRLLLRQMEEGRRIVFWCDLGRFPDVKLRSSARWRMRRGFDMDALSIFHREGGVPFPHDSKRVIWRSEEKGGEVMPWQCVGSF